MAKPRTKLYRLYIYTVNSIAYIPTLICAGYFLLVILLLALSSSASEYKILKHIPFAEIQSAQTARAVITSMLTGIISLTVFSFSMVMVVMNQASSNFSPKVIGGFINNRSNQYILGIYIGTILYLIITLMQVENFNKYSVPHLTIFVGILSSLYCIILFVQFIHTISTSVQVFQVIERIYHDTQKQIKKELQKYEQEETTPAWTATDTWYSYTHPESGYFQKLLEDQLLKTAAEKELLFRTEVPFGSYYVQNTPLFSVNRPLTDEEVVEKFRDCFVFHNGENIKDTSYYGFRQLMEVAVKALSPGINDPGVAILCLERLSDLFSVLMKASPGRYLPDKEATPRVKLQMYDVAALFDLVLLPVRHYGQHDVMVQVSLLELLKNISYNDSSHRYQALLNGYAEDIVSEASKKISSRLDKQYLKAKTEDLYRAQGQYFYADLQTAP